MKRRLTLSILGIVAATLVLAGVGTLLFARVGARQGTEDELRRQAESTADLVSVGQTRAVRVTNDLRDVFCGRVTPQGLGAPARAAFDRAREEVCSGPAEEPVAEARGRVCVQGAQRFVAAVSSEAEAARADFCKSPDQAHLDTFVSALCTAPARTSGTDLAVRRLAQLHNLLCASSGSTASNQLEQTLSKESILLVAVGPDNQLTQGTLPDGLGVADLDPDQLRAGETVSGSMGDQVFAAAPVDIEGDPQESVRAIVIARPANPISDSVQWFLMAAGVTLVLAALVATWLSRALTQPLRRATDVTKQIAAGDLSPRLAEHETGGKRSDELDQLAHSINTMADSLERSRGLERQFLLSVSHDLRTPLTSIRGYAEAIADGAAPDPQGAASIILGESRRLERLVKDLLELAMLESDGFAYNLGDFDVVEIADDSVDGFRREAESAGLQLQFTGPPPGVRLVARCDPDRLQQVIANLLENALKYARQSVTVVLASAAGRPTIEVVDDGPGIAAEDLPHVFERLYVTAHTPERKEVGSGLGLAIVRELMEGMGGSVRAEANPGGGTRLVVTLAVSPVPSASPAPAAP